MIFSPLLALIQLHSKRPHGDETDQTCFVFLTLINYDLFVLPELPFSTVEELFGVCSCNLMRVSHKFPLARDVYHLCLCAMLFIFHVFTLSSSH